MRIAFDHGAWPVIQYPCLGENLALTRPNILLISTDQQRWDALGVSGNSLIETPNLDALATRGTYFDRCIAQNPVCMPSRVSTLTGRYCSALRITHMAVTVPKDTLTLPRILGTYGYHNALIGKLHFLPHSNRDHRVPHPDYGFDHMELADEPGCYEDAYRAWVSKVAPDQLDHISPGLPPAARKWQEVMGIRDGVNHSDRLDRSWKAASCKSDVTFTAFVARQTIEYLKSHRPDPFFCCAGFYSPHSPWIAPQEFLDMYDVDDMPTPNFPPDLAVNRPSEFSDQAIRENTRAYYAMVSEVDHWVGRILETLENEGLADNTVVVFTSDHGEFLGEHMRYGKGPWAPDVVSRVPLIVCVPEALGGCSGRKVGDIVECVDIVPTLLDIAGIPIPPDVQGDLLPVTEKRVECKGDGLGLTEWHGGRSLRMPGLRYVATADGSEMLFDLEKDPWEYHNVACDPTYADGLAEARKALIRRMIRIEQPLPREWPY